MPRFTIKATITVDVALEIDADTIDDAENEFLDSIAMGAVLSGLDEGRYTVTEDTISDVIVNSISRKQA